jgi:hypothetical protein
MTTCFLFLGSIQYNMSKPLSLTTVLFSYDLSKQIRLMLFSYGLTNHHPVRLAYQPPASSTLLSEQTSHQQSSNSTFLSEQISTSHQPPAKRTG